MAKYYIETYGCPQNFADSKQIENKLAESGFEKTSVIEEAEFFIINSCTVKSPTETKIRKRLKDLEKFHRPIILAGCLAQAENDLESLSNYSLLGVYQKENIIPFVEEVINGSTMVLLASGKVLRRDIPHARKNELIEIVTICQGCLGDCAYCKVRYARGRLFSYDLKEIVKTVSTAVASGAKEIWLTAQDTGCYGKDIGLTLPMLLSEILKIPGDFKIRLGMANPNHIYEFKDELAEMFKSDKMFNFLHIPVQSGSNEILKEMHRRYTVEQFIEVINKFREKNPKITIATDIIAGFPSETKEQFFESVKLVEHIRPDVLNISRYWQRPGTEAAKKKEYSGNITNERSRKLSEVFSKVGFNNNLSWMAWLGEILIDEKGKDGSWMGRNFAYKPVIVLSNDDLFGKKLKVRVIDVSKHDLKAKIVGL